MVFLFLAVLLHVVLLSGIVEGEPLANARQSWNADIVPLPEHKRRNGEQALLMDADETTCKIQWQNMSSAELPEDARLSTDCQFPTPPLQTPTTEHRSWWDSMLSYLSFAQWSADYQSLLESSPLVMKTLTAAVVSLGGDVLAQTVIERGSIDWRRSATLAAESLFVSGPLLHYGYGWMDSLFDEATTSWISSLCQVLIDIFIMDSFFTGTLMVVSALLQGQTLRSIVHELRTDYPAAVVAAWASSLSMSPLQFCNFLFIPVKLRVLVTNMQDVIWNAVVSYMAHRNRHPTACTTGAA